MTSKEAVLALQVVLYDLGAALDGLEPQSEFTNFGAQAAAHIGRDTHIRKAGEEIRAAMRDVQSSIETIQQLDSYLEMVT